MDHSSLIISGTYMSFYMSDVASSRPDCVWCRTWPTLFVSYRILLLESRLDVGDRWTMDDWPARLWSRVACTLHGPRALSSLSRSLFVTNRLRDASIQPSSGSVRVGKIRPPQKKKKKKNLVRCHFRSSIVNNWRASLYATICSRIYSIRIPSNYLRFIRQTELADNARPYSRPL